VIVLPRHAENPPPTGYTGFGGKIADDDTITEWIALLPNGNFYFQYRAGGELFEIVGIDVDHYGDKDGGRPTSGVSCN
jgi:hypothetical protein